MPRTLLLLALIAVVIGPGCQWLMGGQDVTRDQWEPPVADQE